MNQRGERLGAPGFAAVHAYPPDVSIAYDGSLPRQLERTRETVVSIAVQLATTPSSASGLRKLRDASVRGIAQLPCQDEARDAGSDNRKSFHGHWLQVNPGADTSGI